MNWLTLVQSGDNNLTKVWQEHHGEVSITQTGNGNDSRVYQSGQPTGFLNSASVFVSGNDNSGTFTQSGSGHEAYLSQGGDGNIGVMNVNGTDHTSLSKKEITIMCSLRSAVYPIRLISASMVHLRIQLGLTEIL